MARYFNTAGPCRPELHYMLPPEPRVPRVRALVEQQGYFVLHAPRQVGKTTALMALAATLTAEGRYAAVVVSMENGAAFADDIGAAEIAVLEQWRLVAELSLPAELRPPPWPDAGPGARILQALSAWASACPRPLVLILDEIDALRDQTLLSVLRQLRSGYALRPKGFPAALGLVGLRDVRDYKVASGGSDRLHTSSPFNIKLDSLTMSGFSQDEIRALYAQHTGDTGQVFEDAAVARAHELSGGHPWLVNALARQAVEVLVTDPSVAIRASDIDRARDLLIERQDTHLDSLAERLRDPRVRAIIAPMIIGDTLGSVPPDDLRFVKDLGLVREADDGRLEVANPIYREIIAKQLAASVRASMPALTPSWLDAAGRIDFVRLREAFVAFWVQHGEALLGSAAYSEAAPHLVLMAWLHRVVNGGGRVEREYAVGSKRLDLCVEYKGARLGIEVKTWRDRDKSRDPAIDGVAQLDEYLARLGTREGWLVVFDQRASAAPLPERARVERVTAPSGRTVEIVRV